MANIAIKRRGLMLVLSSPSGAGKSTIARELLQRDSNLIMSVSRTTRPKRPGEVDGRDYHFVNESEFKQEIERGAFLEHAEVFGHYYGTPAAPVNEALAQGRDVLFDIDWQGGLQLRESKGDDVVSIFILPPSMAELRRRLAERGQDPEDVVDRRMARAHDEISHWADYDYVIINDDMSRSIELALAILVAERAKRKRQSGLFDFVQELDAQDDTAS